MSSHTIEDLTSCILDYQANIVRATYRRKMTDVEPDAIPAHANALEIIWSESKVREEPDGLGGTRKWRLLGFDSEDPTQEFHEVGVLGLQCLVRTSRLCSEWYSADIDSMCRLPLFRRIRTTSPR